MSKSVLGNSAPMLGDGETARGNSHFLTKKWTIFATLY